MDDAVVSVPKPGVAARLSTARAFRPIWYIYGTSRYTRSVCKYMSLSALALWFVFWRTGFNWNVYWVGLSDETTYLGNAINFNWSLFRNYENFPLYSLWYRGFWQALQDPILTYKLGSLTLASLSLILVWLVLQAVSRSLWFALLVFPIFLSTHYFVNVWPRPILLVLVLTCLGLLASLSLTSRSGKAGVVMLACYLCAFVRSEFVLSFYVLGVATLVLLAWEWRASGRLGQRWGWLRGAATPLIAFAVVVGLSAAWSFPRLAGGDRAWVAFGQHYAEDFLRRETRNISGSFEWPALMQEKFGDAKSVGAAWMSNFPEMSSFVSQNGLRTLHFLSEIVTDAWGSMYNQAGAGLLGFYALTLIFLIGQLAIRNAASGQHGLSRQEFPLTNGFILAALLAPSLLSCLQVYPRVHYIVFLLFLIALALGFAFRQFTQSRPLSWVELGAGVVAIILLTMATPRQAPYAFDAPTPRDRVNPEIVLRALRTLDGSQPLRILESDGGWCIHLAPRPCQTVGIDAWRDGEPVSTFLSRTGTTVIVLNALTLWSRFSTSAEWQSLVAAPEAFGFRTLPGAGLKVLVRQP
jgi:hypothetical protein